MKNHNWKKDRQYLLDNIDRLPDVLTEPNNFIDRNEINLKLFRTFIRLIWTGEYDIVVQNNQGIYQTSSRDLSNVKKKSILNSKTRLNIGKIINKLKNTEKQKKSMSDIFMKVKFVDEIDPPRNFYVVLRNSGESIGIRTFRPYAFINSTVEYKWQEDYPTLYKTIEKNASNIWDYNMKNRSTSNKSFEWKFQDGKLTRKLDPKIKFSLWKYYRNLEEIKGFVNPVHTYYSLLYDLINNNGSNIVSHFDENTGFFRSFKKIDSCYEELDFINDITEQRDIECVCYALQTFDNISHEEIKKALKSTKELVKEYLTEI